MLFRESLSFEIQAEILIDEISGLASKLTPGCGVLGFHRTDNYSAGHEYIGIYYFQTYTEIEFFHHKCF